MAIVTRFRETARGALTITGNVLGTAGDFYGDGILNFTKSNPPLPPGGLNTTTWQDNSSTAYLNIPSGANVLYAELSWSGQYIDSISSYLNNSIILTSPLGLNTISPDPLTSQTITIPQGIFYSRTQDVTDIVSGGGAGYYTAGSVPGFLSGGNDYLGWCLVVAFASNSLPIRNMTIWALLEGVSGGSGVGTVDVNIANFATPPSGDVFGRLMVCAGGGNSNLTGDFLQFGPTTGALQYLSGPNNPISNFFCSQINIGNSLNPNVGNVNTDGTFGTWNSTPPNQAIYGDRNSFDITNVNALGLTNNQTTGVVRFGTTDDTYQPIALALQIDVNSPAINPIKTAPTVAKIGDTVTFTVSFSNTGSVDALNTTFYDTIPNGTVFQVDSLVYNGSQQIGANPSPVLGGFYIGTLPVNAVGTISFKVQITTIPSPNPIQNRGIIGYIYTPGSGIPSIQNYQTSNTTRTTVEYSNISQIKSVDKAYADISTILLYNIAIYNMGNTTLSTIRFQDTIPSILSLISSTLKYNNSPISGNIADGITLPSSIGPSQVGTVSFQATVNALPTSNPIVNYSSSTSLVFFSSQTTPNVVQTQSNGVPTYIQTASLSETYKYADKLFATCGDTITYTITMKNTGNVPAQNVVLKDTVPNGLNIVPNSVYINGVLNSNESLSTGITLPNIQPGYTTTVVFSAKVIC